MHQIPTHTTGNQQQPPPQITSHNVAGNEASYLSVAEGYATGRRAIRLQHKPFEFADGKAKVVFDKAEDDLLAEKCKFTMVGKFPRTRPQIDKLREEFKKTFPLKGAIKIGAFDWRHVFINFIEEEDFKRYKDTRTMYLCGMTM